MKPPSTSNERGVGLAGVTDAQHALQLLAHGQRAERRAAARWLRRKRKRMSKQIQLPPAGTGDAE
jgi:hypothetical protein